MLRKPTRANDRPLTRERKMRYESELAYPHVAIQAEASERAAFIRRTYAHLAGAILAFAGLEAVLLQFVTPEQVFGVFGNSPFSLLFLMIAFIGASWVAQTWARSETSRAIQYLGLGLYVVVQAFIFVPLLYYANARFPDTIATAGILTLCMFGGLTVAVFVTRKDYSFLGPVLSVASFLALGLILVACFFPIGGLGMWFSFAMIALASGYILYQTSNVMLHYRTDQHVAAALGLFSSVAMLFYYILRVLVASRR
jgi:FtsH-binding integral membrane protein